MPNRGFTLPKVQIIPHCHLQELDLTGDAHMKLVEQFLIFGSVLVGLGNDDWVGVKRFVMKFLIESEKLHRKLLYKAMHVTL